MKYIVYNTGDGGDRVILFEEYLLHNVFDDMFPIVVSSGICEIKEEPHWDDDDFVFLEAFAYDFNENGECNEKASALISDAINTKWKEAKNRLEDIKNGIRLKKLDIDMTWTYRNAVVGKAKTEEGE